MNNRHQPSTPLLVIKDSPSSDNASDLEDSKSRTVDSALLNGSSSSFGGVTARSAPCTPQGLQNSSPPVFTDPNSQQPGTSPGNIVPVIHRSPSHVFSKAKAFVDMKRVSGNLVNLMGLLKEFKNDNDDNSTSSSFDGSSDSSWGNIKQLSSSAPIMTAQARTPEPPSPKATTKEDKLPTTSKARQKKFHRHFPTVDLDEKVLNYYSCALIGDILLQGHLYITKNYFAFYSNVFGYVTKLLIPLLTVEKITKERTAKIIPNAVGVVTNEDKHVFGSLMSRDNTFRLMIKVWDAARNCAMQNSINVEAELLAAAVPSECSDSSKSSESGNESGIADSGTTTTFETMGNSTRIKKIPPLTPAKLLKSESADGKKSGSYSSFFMYRIPTQTLLLCVSTFLLLFLFLSAAVLLYRIGKVQNKYNLALQENLIVSEGKDVYSELLQWQAQLHSKSAGAVHNFLDSNLDQLAKVRQSLEALSSLLVDEAGNANKSSKSDSPKASSTPTSSSETQNNS